MIKLMDDNYCFACGRANPIGLKLPIRYKDGKAWIENYVIKKEFQGYKDIVHGGILALILDELSVYALGSKGYRGMTGKLEVRFKSPVSTEQPVNAEAEVIELHKKWAKVKGVIFQNGRNCVEAVALIFIF